MESPGKLLYGMRHQDTDLSSELIVYDSIVETSVLFTVGNETGFDSRCEFITRVDNVGVERVEPVGMGPSGEVLGYTSMDNRSREAE